MSKELKPEVALKHLYIQAFNSARATECYECVEKELKAIEIIKEKAVNIYYVEITNNYINYNRCIDEFFGNYEHRSIYYLTQEEFDLLKEALL